jgi:hypothetical protein
MVEEAHPDHLRRRLRSEVELVDVAGIEDVGLAQQNLPIGAYRK